MRSARGMVSPRMYLTCTVHEMRYRRVAQDGAAATVLNSSSLQLFH